MKTSVANAPAATQPRVIREADAMREVVRAAQSAGKRVGFVPTMGALHAGHLSLLDAARAECDLTVASIFVNPTQFGPQEDLNRYPRDLDGDLAQLADHGCELVFAPSVDEMYPREFATTVDVGPLARELEGEIRPGHFAGVATVVLKLFGIVGADVAFFGRKDYQQSLVIRKLVADLNVPVEIRVCPTIREPDGLAMSSRNAYLSADERRRALALSESLRLAERLVREGESDVDAIRRKMLEHLRAAGVDDVEYFAFVADGTIAPVRSFEGPTTVAIAARVGSTRLIDNVCIG